MPLYVVDFRTTQSLGRRFASPPGGRDEDPVTNWTNSCRIKHKYELNHGAVFPYFV